MRTLKTRILRTQPLATLLLSGVIAACTVGDTTGARPSGADAAPDAGVAEAELQWTATTDEVPLLQAAMHYVSDTEIYAIVDNKICKWDGTAWADHSPPAIGLAAAMHFVSPTQIYAVIGNVVKMYDGTVWVDIPGMVAKANISAAGDAEIHWVSDTEIYAVIVAGVDSEISMFNGTAWATMTGPTPDLQYSMDFKSATEIYAVIGTKICMWDGTAFAIISPDQANLRPGIQVVSDTEMYAVIGEKICKWDGTAWADITTDMVGLHPEFLRTSDEDILAMAGTSIQHWALTLP